MTGFFVGVLLILVGALLAVAFFTLFERKVLGLTQRRVGPNKVTIWGILQPLLDGVKLLTKEFIYPHFVSVWGFVSAPAIFFGLIIILWSITNVLFFVDSQNLFIFTLLSVLGGGIYTSLITGVNSFSKFALVGGTRSAAQAISYEICLAFFLFIFLLVWFSLNISNMGVWAAPLIIFWFVLILSETNRAPFDFAEGERELIRGFNVEFRSIGFVFLFLGEYGIILFIRFLTRFLFSSSHLPLTLIFRFLVVLVRSTLPRFRYDFLIGVFWIFFLPLRVVLLGFCCVFL